VGVAMDAMAVAKY